METTTVRKRLEEMRGELDKSISVLQSEQPVDRDMLSTPQDQADAGTSLYDADRARAQLTGLRLQRLEVVDALDRVERGTYGVCADCGGLIPQGRLEARPEATRCVACQAKRDRGRR